MSLAEGAVETWAKGDMKLVGDALARLHEVHGIDLPIPVRKLTKRQRDVLLFGSTATAQRRPSPQATRRRRLEAQSDPFGADFEGLLPNLRRRYEEGTWRNARRSSRIAPSPPALPVRARG